MALKIDTNQSATAYHITDGPVLFPYAIDAQHAVSNHPLEWRDSPWTREHADEARSRLRENHDRDVAVAKARGVPAPEATALLADPVPLSPEDQAALDEHNKAVAAAAERLAKYHAKKAAEQAEAEQIAADEALVVSAPPAPDPARRRPFGRPGEPTAAELAQIKKREEAAAAKKAADDKVAKDKADADKLAGNTPVPQP